MYQFAGQSRERECMCLVMSGPSLFAGRDGALAASGGTHGGALSVGRMKKAAAGRPSLAMVAERTWVEMASSSLMCTLSSGVGRGGRYDRCILAARLADWRFCRRRRSEGFS